MFITILITGIQLIEKETIHLCLTEIENMLQANRKSLWDFPLMPYPIGYAGNPHHNKLIYNEMAYDKQILVAEFNRLYRVHQHVLFVSYLLDVKVMVLLVNFALW